jgi:hypothetical protein
VRPATKAGETGLIRARSKMEGKRFGATGNQSRRDGSHSRPFQNGRQALRCDRQPKEERQVSFAPVPKGKASASVRPVTKGGEMVLFRASSKREGKRFRIWDTYVVDSVRCRLSSGSCGSS